MEALRRAVAGIDGVEADVAEADTITQAREALRMEEFACVFLDHDLPDGTSLDLLTEIRSQGFTTPVVVLTGHRDEQAIGEVMQADAVDYLPKDKLHPDLIARSLRAALLFRQTQREKQVILDEMRARDRAFAAAPNGIVMADPHQPDCPLIYVNAAFLRMTGYTEEEALGRNCRFLQGERTSPAAVQELREGIREERTCQVSLLNYRKDGSAFLNEVMVSPVRDARGALTHFIGVQTDVTARHEADAGRRRAEDTLRRSREDLRMAVEGARLGTFYCDYPLDKIIWNDICKEHFFLPPDAEVDFALFYSLLHPDDHAPTRQAIERAMVEHVEYDVEYRTLAPDGRTRWVNAVGRFYCGPDGNPVRFDGITIDISARKQAEAELTARAEREALLNQIGQAIRTTLDPDEIQQVAVRALGEALRADRCYFSLYDLEADLNWVGNDFRRGDLPSLAGRYRLSDFQVNAEDYYPNGRTFVVPDALDAAWSFPEALLTAIQQLRVRSAIGVPFFDGGRLVATLSVAMADEPRAWTDDEVRLVEAVASQTRSAVEAARLLAERQARLETEALLGRIGAAIRSTLDPDLIQGRAATLLGEALRTDRCFYVSYDLAHDHAQVFQDWHRADLPSIAGEYSASDFSLLLGELFPAQATAVVADVRTAFSPAVASVFEASRHRAVLVVPFFDEGRLVAALYVSEADTPRTWTADEAALVEQVATLTRTALETARVQEQEHRIAVQLQDALQPALPEHVPGMSVGKFTKPALDEAQIGGDFYDIFPLDKELYACVIGDVSGKGLAAAQQLALIRNSLRTTLYLYRAPAQAVAALNSIVTTHDLLVGFVTAWVGVYDAASGQISYCSCGHEPPLIRRADGAVETLATTGLPLGVAENVEYGEKTVTLSAGDLLVLYTDGISECGPSRREMLGTEGLKRLLGSLPVSGDAQAEVEALVAEVSAFTNGLFRDDVAILLAHRN